MNILTELGDTVCGETHRAMERTNLWLLGKMHKAKKKGKLGVINLRSQNRALLKYLDKFYNKIDIPWVNLI
jgi:hypothetical protein